MIFCFNELSLQNLDIVDSEILEKTLLKFLLILKNAVDKDGFPEVRTENGMWGTVINDKPINELIYHSAIDKDLKSKRKINQCIEKAPDLCYPFFISLGL